MDRTHGNLSFELKGRLGQIWKECGMQMTYGGICMEYGMGDPCKIMSSRAISTRLKYQAGLEPKDSLEDELSLLCMEANKETS